MKQKYISLLLVTTLLTACGGDTTSDADKKVAEGITDDGTKGESPTIKGGGSTILTEEVLAKKEVQNKLQPLRDTVSKALTLAAAINSKSLSAVTSAQVKQVVDLIPPLFVNGFAIYGVFEDIYDQATAKYKKFDAKGDFSAGSWGKIIELNDELSFYEELSYSDPQITINQNRLMMSLTSEFGLSMSGWAFLTELVEASAKALTKVELDAEKAASVGPGETEGRVVALAAILPGESTKDSEAKAKETIPEIKEKTKEAFKDLAKGVLSELEKNIPVLWGKIKGVVFDQLIAQLQDILVNNLDKVVAFQKKQIAFSELTNGSKKTDTTPAIESLKDLKHVVDGAIDRKIQALFFDKIERETEGDIWEQNKLSQRGVDLGNAISNAIAKKGFVRLVKNKGRDQEAPSFALESEESEESKESLQFLVNTLMTLARHSVSSSSSIGPDLELLSGYNKGIFGVKLKAVKDLGVGGIDDKEDEVYANFSSFWDLNGRTFSATSISSTSSTSKLDLTPEQYYQLELNLYKAFFGALIPRKEFKGLFDFLKTTHRYKDDPEFMALFAPSAAKLSSGAIRDVSTAALSKARKGNGAVNLAGFKMNGVSGQSIDLGMPLFVQLKGDVSSVKSTEAATGSVAYRLGNTVIGAIQGYANSGAGFGTDSSQLETSVVASHSFGSFFVEGQIGSVSATDVHESSWSGYRSQITVGLDTEFVSPFVQVSHRQLDRDGEYGLNDTTAYVGLDMDIARLAADTYSIDTRLLAKAGYGSKKWSANSNDLGSTTGFSGSVEWSASLNLNSGVSFGTNLALDTVAGSSAAVNVSLDR